MKSYVCIVGVLCALAQVKCEPSEEMKKNIQECAKETGLPEPEGYSKGTLNFDDPKVKCLYACIMKKKGTLVDGKVVAEKSIELAAKHLPEGATDAVKADINECATKANEGKEECEVGGTFHHCLIEKYSKRQ